MVFTEDGIIALESDLQPENASFPMDVTDEGMSMDSSEVQPWNARSPMDFTEGGMFMLTSFLHSRNMSLSILDVLGGTVNVLNPLMSIWSGLVHFPEDVAFSNHFAASESDCKRLLLE